MSFRLFCEAIIKFLCGVLLVGALIFIPAGTLEFIQGVLLMGVLFIPMLAAGVVMMIKNPSLLKSRLDAKEKMKDQDTVIKLSGLMFIIGFVIAGLNHRFDWYTLPIGVSVAGAVLLIIGYLLFAEVLRENRYLSRTIKVVEGQTIVDTGAYGVVRHPMYTASLILFISMPIILGSLYSLIVFSAYPFIIAKRIRGEERLLENELAGYSEYKKKVKYRLIPFIW